MKVNNIILVLHTRITLLSSLVVHILCICYLVKFSYFTSHYFTSRKNWISFSFNTDPFVFFPIYSGVPLGSSKDSLIVGSNVYRVG